MYKTEILIPKDQVVGITELQRNASAVSAKAKEKDILVLKNNSPYVVMMDYDRYQILLEKIEQAGIYAMLQERKKDPEWFTTKEVIAGLSFDEPGGTPVYGESAKSGKPATRSASPGVVRSKGNRRVIRGKATVAR